LIFVDRETYSWRNERSYHQELWEKFGSFYLIPEGGANFQGVTGCQEILQEPMPDIRLLYCAAGTGTTAAGLMLATNNIKVNAINVLKGVGDTEIKRLLYACLMDGDSVEELLNEHIVSDDYHLGGYAKWSYDLIELMRNFYDET